MFKYVGEDEKEPVSKETLEQINAVTKHLINKENKKALEDFNRRYQEEIGNGGGKE